jgi:uncharacterized protein RhaS with RHS repeats
MGITTQEDPIGVAGGVNLYGYADGDPVNNTDPLGLMSCPPDCHTGNGLSGEAAAHVLFGLRDAAPSLEKMLVNFIASNATMATGGAALEVGVSALAARTASTFYRGVGAAEAADIAAHGGRLRAGASAAGNEGKYLTNTVEAASQWGAAHGPGSVVMRVDVPADAVRMFTRLGRIDGVGEAWHAPMSSLRGARATPIQSIIPLTTIP